jgi:hypothetical protein
MLKNFAHHIGEAKAVAPETANRFQPFAAALTDEVGYLGHATVFCGWPRWDSR